MCLSNKGFFLLDALLAVFIVSCICILCFSIHNLMDIYERGYAEYQEQSNRRYEYIYNSLSECEACSINEYD
ncbi:MAG: hypothetical protein IK151_05335 [Erysipelotrichaceae bacterium]|nr:hypothetical protein [Erysipelotrichaceae bacterium]